jgi:hypothetical protein
MWVNRQQYLMCKLLFNSVHGKPKLYTTIWTFSQMERRRCTKELQFQTRDVFTGAHVSGLENNLWNIFQNMSEMIDPIRIQNRRRRRVFRLERRRPSLHYVNNGADVLIEVSEHVLLNK